VTDPYATAAEYRAALDKTDTAEDAEVLLDLTSVSRWLDMEYGRFFTKDAAAVARKFYGRATTDYALRIDDLVSVTSVKSDDNDDGTAETTWAATDYQLLPLNADKGSEPRPYDHIIVPRWSTKGAFVDRRLIEITGVWGWPAVPEAIKRATIYITSIIRLEGNRGISQVTDLGTIITANPQARSLVERLGKTYSRKAFAV
jgi:hypothetical protein